MVKQQSSKLFMWVRFLLTLSVYNLIGKVSVCGTEFMGSTPIKHYFMNRFFYNTLISSQKHPYHVVTKSPWPLSLSLSLGLSVLLLVLKLVSQIHFFFLHLSVYFVLFVIANWCENILTESSSGHHTRQVRKGLRLGFFLMIISEIMFFFSFFWTLFHYTFSLNIWHSEKWPYVWGIPELDCTPWIGTIFLIGSSFWISEAKIDFILGDKKKLYLNY